MRHFFFLACLVMALCLPGCKTVEPRADDAGFASGRPSFGLQLPEGFSLIAAGRTTAEVPADIPLPPQGRLRYALYADEGTPKAFVHVLVTELPTPAWRFALESSRDPEDLAFAKETRDGRFLTLRTRVVRAEGDWFCALAGINGQSSPGWLLARRVSFTPNIYTRVVLEYREPLPDCLLPEVADTPANARPRPDYSAVRATCSRELDAFAKRADAALTLGDPMPLPEVAAGAAKTPEFAPNLRLLCGMAEHVEHDDPDYNR